MSTRSFLNFLNSSRNFGLLAVASAIGVCGAIGGGGGFSAESTGGSAPKAKESLYGTRTGSTPPGLSTASGALSEGETRLLADLREGGYVILLLGESPESPGAPQAARLAEATLDELQIPVNRIVTDQPTGATRQQSSNRSKVETSEALARHDFSGTQRVDEVDPELRELLSTQPPRGQNTVLVASASAGYAVSENPELGATIFKPLGAGDLQRVAHIPAQRSAELTEAHIATRSQG